MPAAPVPSHTSERRLATLSAAAEYLGGSHPSTVRRYIERGTLTGYRLGGRIFVDLDEIDSALRVIPTVATREGGGDHDDAA